VHSHINIEQTKIMMNSSTHLRTGAIGCTRLYQCHKLQLQSFLVHTAAWMTSQNTWLWRHQL